jgi:hypothetical protein
MDKKVNERKQENRNKTIRFFETVDEKKLTYSPQNRTYHITFILSPKAASRKPFILFSNYKLKKSNF